MSAPSKSFIRRTRTASFGLSRKRSTPPGIDLRQVERLAELSRLALTPQEAERMRGEFAAILDYFAALDRVHFPKGALAEEASAESGMRDDVVGPSIPRELLEGVPQKKGRYVRAPRVF
jgi:aspartyl/glutamyl-tRNA(Asn/Gln) amidotransferase C subunit